MCGIIGYVGMDEAAPILSEGLKRLEYRGYDSLGIAVTQGESVQIFKEKGMANEVLGNIDINSIMGKTGIGHTRWATHGPPCRENAHPHSSCNNEVALVHNGVIENFNQIKEWLLAKGHAFRSDTDTEAIAHLIEEELKTKKPNDAFRDALSRLEGSYAIVCMIAGTNQLMCARKSSPLVIGIGSRGHFCASDMPAILDQTKTFIPLEDGESAQIDANDFLITNEEGQRIKRDAVTVGWDAEMAQKGGYPHFMAKEIDEQKESIANAIASDTRAAEDMVGQSPRVDIVACGTSFHAGMMLASLLQKQGKTAQAFIASDYPQTVLPPKDALIIAMTQSGETADVLQAVRYAKGKGCKVIAVTNVNGSTITGLGDNVVLLNCGPEIGVAATKTFTAQLAIAYKLALGQEILNGLPGLIGEMLDNKGAVDGAADALSTSSDVFFLGRGISVPVAYEGSLKFKEITYIHSEAYPGGELKHGTLSLIEDGVPVVVLAPSDSTLPKLLGNIREVRARGAKIVSITDNSDVEKESEHSIALPKGIKKELYPFAMMIPLQVLAYKVSTMKGINPDRPRNLAKSVTVE
jgi:glucosamine--fructose-6-phosphate aminotransferase (isomerizing)